MLLRALVLAIISIKDFFIRLRYKIASISGYKNRASKTKKYRITPKDITISKSRAVKKNNSRPSKKEWWKSKAFISACAVIIVAAVTVTIVLAGNGDKPETITAMMSNEDTISTYNTQDNTDQQVDNYNTSNASVQNQQVSSSNQTTTKPVSSTTSRPTPIATTEPVEEKLVPGVNDLRVIKIQQRLMELGYMDMDEPTDYYGYGTEYALQLFQRKHNLQVDGIVGDVTLQKLYSDEAMQYTVKQGDRGTDVASLQKRLQALKYLKAGSTGYFGTDTEAAVKAFQKRNGLYADGNVGEQTREALYSSSARAAKTSSSSGGSSSGGGGSGTGNKPVVVGDPDSASANALIEFALTQLGKPYVRGGKGPKTFDCSGFVYYCLNRVGNKIRYMTSTAWRSANYSTIKSFRDIKRGDILCFNGHVGIYMGNGKMVDASSSNGKIVTRSNIFGSSYWKRNFRCAKRVF